MKFTAVLLSFLLAMPVLGQNRFVPGSNAPDLLHWAFQENTSGMGGTSNTIVLEDSSPHGTIGWLQQPYTIPWELNQVNLSNGIHFNGGASQFLAW